MSKERFDVVVVGSGFGGAINALRAAEAGASVLLLERGSEYRPADFPRDPREVGRLFWEQPSRSDGTAGAKRGLYELRMLSGIGTVTASGLGGGSLVYANIHVRPDADVFEDPRWPRAFRRVTLDPYFDRVASMLRISPIPPEVSLPKRDALREAAKRLRREAFDPDMAVAWKDPGVEGRQACDFRADCEFGCPIGAKGSLDLTYIAEARRRGVVVRTGAFVSHVEPTEHGYRVHYEDLEARGSGGRAPRTVEGRRVVLAAGTLGTHEVLFRSRDELRTLPGVSMRLGHGFSGNGDFLGSIQSSARELEPWHGTDVTTVLRYNDAAEKFTLAAPSFNRAVMEVLASHGQPRVGWLRFLSPFLWKRLPGIFQRLFAKGDFSRPLPRPMRNAGPPGRMTNLFAIGRDNAGGRVVYRRGRLDVRWRYFAENKALVRRMEASMREVADAYGGTFGTLFTWQVFRRILTVHPLGGCRLSESPAEGVVSTDGEVHGYPGLYVSDGSVIPTSIGFHPCMTIAGVSERIAERVVAGLR